jgi:hypothetical protein
MRELTVEQPEKEAHAAKPTSAPRNGSRDFMLERSAA